MLKLITLIMFVTALLLSAINTPLFAQAEPLEVEPPPVAPSVLTGPLEFEPSEPAQPEIIQEDTPVAEPPASIQPAIIPPPGSAGPSEPAQPAVIQGDTSAALPPPVLTGQTEAEPCPPVPLLEPESPKTQTRTAPAYFEYRRSKAKPRTSPPPHSSAFVFPAGYISASVRGGYRKYDGVPEYQYVGRNVMFMYGGMAGKRFALKNRRLRFQLAAEAGWGSTEEDVYDYETGYIVFEKSSEYIQLSTFGVQTDMHILFPTLARSYFLYAGPGLHRSSFSFSLKNNGQLIWKNGNVNTVSPSLNIGAGIESTLNEHRAVSFAYNLRIWRPVYYIETGDLFPMGVDYKEFFYTHSLHLQILLPGTKKGSFFH